jgi:hypothetical protein
MSEAALRIVYRKPRDGNVLQNLDISEVSMGGEIITDLVGADLNIRADGVPKLTLTRMARKVCPVLDSINVDGWFRVEIVTE